MENPRLKITWQEVLRLTEGSKVVPLAELNKHDGDVIAIQHIIENDIDLAKKMARMEMEEEIGTTFFLCTSRPYFMAGSLHANYLLQLRHEIGLEFDLMTIAASQDKGVHYHMIEVLKAMIAMGIRICGFRFLEEKLAGQSALLSKKYFYDFSSEEQSIELRDKIGNVRHLLLGVHPMAEYRIDYLDTMVYRQETIDDRKVSTSEELELKLLTSGKKVLLVHTDDWSG